MDTKQPEALRLAYTLDLLAMDMKTPRMAATELRRQHAEIETLRAGYDAARLEIASLRERCLHQISEPANAGWCDGCSPDNCGGCVTPASPAQAGEPWYGHKFKEQHRGIWRCECGKTVKETTADWLDMAADELRNLRTETAALCADYDADRAARGAAQASECGNCFEGETDRGHTCRKCGGTGVAQALDAERYRWLREYAIGAYITAQGKGSTAIYLLTKVPALGGIGEETDTAIDAARAAQEGK